MVLGHKATPNAEDGLALHGALLGVQVSKQSVAWFVETGKCSRTFSGLQGGERQLVAATDALHALQTSDKLAFLQNGKKLSNV